MSSLAENKTPTESDKYILTAEEIMDEYVDVFKQLAKE